ncbi:MAG TPA: MerR family transcriptional regulator [Pseudonocardiaceae bacterium]
MTGLLTIGAFARAARLSPKALRLYDELGLLVPAEVDAASGYRRYAPEQLERARLVAWLRRLGMPLARIRVVCDLPPAAAAEEVARYWAAVEAATDVRRDLAAFLVAHLSPEPEDTTMTTTPLAIRYAVRTDRGLVREANQDRAHAGSRLLAVADGFGPYTGPDQLADVAIEELVRLDGAIPAGSLLDALQDAARRAGAAVRERVAADPALAGGGTTLTALLWSGSRLALVHVGDSRAYLLRGGELFRLTHDHSVVQELIDDGRLTEEEAASHPQRAILVRALHGGDEPVTPDAEVRDVEPGDRYLLCSDGLHTVVGGAQLRAVLLAEADPDAAADRLVALANAAGGPDNIACVVADIVAA